jgi:lysyl endopeptidase
MTRWGVVFVLSLAASVRLLAQPVEPFFQKEPVGLRRAAPPSRIAEKAAFSPAVTLRAATAVAADEIVRLHQWNASGHLPAKNGFSRAIEQPVSVRMGGGAVASMAAGTQPFARGLITRTPQAVVWGAAFHVSGAYRLRLRLDDAVIPPGATLWVYGEDDEPVAFGRELVDAEGTLWTPSIGGGTVYLEAETPNGEETAFTIRALMEIVGAEPRSEDLPSCLIDASCVTSTALDVIDSYRRAVAQLQYVKDGGNYVCSGALLTDRNATGTPYLLTANHCFSNGTSATSLEAYWDYRTPSCGGTAPSFGSLPRSNGSTMLVTSASSDYTFVRLNSIPGGRWLLGWDPRPASIQNGTLLHRISFPFPDGYPAPYPQSYSWRLANTLTSTCGSLPRPNFIYSQAGQGGTYGGSSGSVTILSGGYVVGQLYGACGPAPGDGCDFRNYNVDGAFAMTYSGIASYLEATPPKCQSSSTTACLSNKRFSVSVKWKTSGGQSGDGQAIEYTPDSALFWFFGSTNIEMILKILNGCGLNQKYWVFAAATTDVEYTITVKDTTTGVTKTYFKAAGTPAPAITDTSAFASCQ